MFGPDGDSVDAAAAVSVDNGTSVSPVASFDNDWQRQQYRNYVASGGYRRFYVGQR